MDKVVSLRVYEWEGEKQRLEHLPNLAVFLQSRP